MSDAGDEPWTLTIVLLEGLRHMRPEKSWRPIVTIDVDNHHGHETTLGVDGQSVNQKEVFRFSDNATLASNVEIKVWQKSQSKKKGKRRNLVASASRTLGELATKQDLEARIDIPLQCRAMDGTRSVSSRGRPQKGAMIRLKLRKPPHLLARRTTIDSLNDGPSSEHAEHAPSSCYSSSAPSSRCPTPPPELSPIPTQTRRKRRGYIIDSDCENLSSDESDNGDNDNDDDCDPNDSKSWLCDDSTQTLVNDDSPSIEYAVTIRNEEHTHSFGWIAAALLPTYTEAIKVPAPLNPFEKAMARFTMYHELKVACMDSHYDEVFKRLQMEWTYIGGLLVALAAVDTAVFSISSDSIINVGSYARAAIAASSIASGLGITCDAWFLMRYNWADLQTFKTRAKDVYESYFFFSLSSRVPALCMFISAFSLMTFLGLVAFDLWPQGVTFVCFIVGVIMSLQFLVYGVHKVGVVMVEGGRAGRRGVGRVVRGMSMSA